MKIKIKKTECLTIKKVKRDFKYLNIGNGLYFAEVEYGEGGAFYDLYIRSSIKIISQNQIDVFNTLNNNLNAYKEEVEKYLMSALTNFEQKRKVKINNKKLNIDVLEIQEDNSKYDAVLICGKEYKYFRFLKKDIGIRVEIKNGIIKSMERKIETTIENK